MVVFLASESVTEGHQNMICDQISDEIYEKIFPLSLGLAAYILLTESPLRLK